MRLSRKSVKGNGSHAAGGMFVEIQGPGDVQSRVQGFGACYGTVA